MLLQIVDTVFTILSVLLRLYSGAWLVWIILSWLTAFNVLQVNYDNPLVRFIGIITDGLVDLLFGRFRDRLIVASIDFAPFVFLMIFWYIVPRLLWMLRSMIVRMIIG